MKQLRNLMMKFQNSDLYEELRPRKWGSFDVEPFQDYRKRVYHLLPNWPSCPLENWLHRHFNFVISSYGWLDFQAFNFSRMDLRKDDIFLGVKSHILDDIDDLGQKIFSTPISMQTWLQQYMLENNTWPVPIIILKNFGGLISPSKEVYGVPYHLLEGHLRLGYFRNIYLRDNSILANNHSVWVVDY